MEKIKKKNLFLIIGTMFAVVLAVLGGWLLAQTSSVVLDNTYSDSTVFADPNPTGGYFGENNELQWTYSTKVNPNYDEEMWDNGNGYEEYKPTLGILTISGTGDFYAYDSSDCPWYEFYSDIADVIISGNVKSVSGEFYGTYSPYKLTIGDNVEKIDMESENILIKFASLNTKLHYLDFDFYNTYEDGEPYEKWPYSNGYRTYDYDDEHGCIFTSCYVDVGNIENTYKVLYRVNSQGNFDGHVVLPANIILTFNDTFYDISESLNQISINSSLININDGLCEDCEYLTSISFNANSSLKYIGANSFNGTAITTVSIPEGVKTIGDYAFCMCLSLGNIQLPNSLDYLGYRALDWVSENLVFYTDESGNKYLGNTENNYLVLCHISENSNGVLTIKNGVKFVGGTFTGGQGIGLLGEYDEYGNVMSSNVFHPYNVTSVELPNTVKQVCNDAFSYSKINNVILPNGLKYIDKYAFSNCIELKNISIPASVEYIGEQAFLGCNRLVEVYDLRSTPGTKQGEWYSTRVNGIKTSLSTLSSLETINGVIYFKDDSTHYSAVDLVDHNAQSIEFNEKCTSINQYAFYDCANLTAVEIPENIVEIGDRAFQGCSSLSEVTLNCEEVPTLGYKAFNNTNSNLTIYVESGRKGEYTSSSSNWLALQAKIVEIETPETGVLLNLSIVFVTLILGFALVALAFEKKEQ